MTRDPNYWKKKYKGMWKIASQREEKVKKYLEEQGFKIEFFGLGSGTEEFLEGSADKYGYKKGEPDLWVVDTNIFIEVTGTNSPYVKKSAPLWIRPDKIESAKNDPSRDVWLVHVLDRENLLRCIQISNLPLNKFNKKVKIIRGAREVYIEISATDPVVHPIKKLVEYIRAYKKSHI
ncbi:hypothetical protein [Ardenticatena maritima]|uniref:hypothetical protein n=1 Tax=Ardenticatena maritima TaxID=872965 RepID=UPI00128FBEB6|nr:hypothetical protein [Ardenticatena maritima]